MVWSVRATHLWRYHNDPSRSFILHIDPSHSFPSKYVDAKYIRPDGYHAIHCITPIDRCQSSGGESPPRAYARTCNPAWFGGGRPPGHFQLYGDSAYTVSAILMSPHAWVGVLTAAEHAWNTEMGEVHISVKHAFGIVLQDWPFLHTSWKHQVFGTACGRWYRAAVLLANAHNCFVPNQTAQCYNCMPPSILEYFHN